MPTLIKTGGISVCSQLRGTLEEVEGKKEKFPSSRIKEQRIALGTSSDRLRSPCRLIPAKSFI